jgi:tetratricopeptide (TPR) repeat protein
VGREALLDDLDGLFGSLAMQSPSTERGWQGARFVWIYGLGGMGKSWLLRTAYLRAQQKFQEPGGPKVGLIDWHSPLWREPLERPPRQPRHIFQAIAHRLTQLYGEGPLDLYWKAESRVDLNAKTHAEFVNRFGRALDHIRAVSGSGTADELLQLDTNAHVTFRDELLPLQEYVRDCLREWGHWPSNPHDSLLEAVSERVGEHDPAVSRPDDLLGDALRDSIRLSVNSEPLLLLLDTCEYLDERMERVLRRVLTPLLIESSRLAVVIASRSQPDVDFRPGQRGWLAEIPERRRRLVPFDKHVRFSTEEIREILSRVPGIIQGDLPDIAETLHGITLGLPVAVEPFITMIDSGSGLTLTDVLGDSRRQHASSIPDENKAIREVIGFVADRFLLHLDRNADRRDLRDTIAIALLRMVDREVLRRVWGTDAVDERLRALSRRYSLLEGGELHAEVRYFLRKRWRVNRPFEFEDVLDRVKVAVRDSKPCEATGSAADFDWRLETLNIETWELGENVLGRVGPTLCVGAAYRLDVESLMGLLGEIPAVSDGRKREQGFMMRYRYISSLFGRWMDGDLIKWLQNENTDSWEPEERACRDLVLGFACTQKKDYGPAVKYFESALPRFSNIDQLPQPEDVAEAYLDAVFWHTIDHRNDQSALIRASKWADGIGLRTASIWRRLGNLAHNLDDWPRAIAAYRHAIDQEPNDTVPYQYLVHVYEHHTADLAAAEKVYRDALAATDNQGWALIGLGRVLRSTGRDLEALKVFEEACELEGDPFAYASVADILRKDSSRLEQARIAAASAVKALRFSNQLETLGSIMPLLGRVHTIKTMSW